MQFTSVLLAAAAFAAANAAQFTMTPQQFVSVKVGTPFNLTWSGASGPVTLKLKNGAANDLKDVETIATSLTGTTYSWTPESTLPSGTYAFEIDDSGVPNYSVQFTLAGGVASSSSGSSSASSSSSSASSSTTGSSSTTSTGSSSSATATTTGGNSTSSTSGSKTTSASKTSSATGSSTSSTTSPSSLSSASSFSSPLAFVLLAVAALMTLN